MQARLRRLRADFDRVSVAFADHPFIRVLAVEGDPPEKYTFELKVRGLVASGEEEMPVPKTMHRVEVFCRSTIRGVRRSAG